MYMYNIVRIYAATARSFSLIHFLLILKTIYQLRERMYLINDFKIYYVYRSNKKMCPNV